MADRSPLLVAGAVDAALAVGLGAFAAHGLKARLEQGTQLSGPRLLEVFETGARYQMYHALAILLCGVLVQRYPGATTAGWLFQIGIILFSGSLYALALTDTPALGAVTPFGGLAFIAGWLWLAYVAWRG